MISRRLAYRFTVIGSVLSLVAGVLAGAGAIGSPLRWVQVIGLVASGAAFGAGLSKAIGDRRAGGDE